MALDMVKTAGHLSQHWFSSRHCAIKKKEIAAYDPCRMHYFLHSLLAVPVYNDWSPRSALVYSVADRNLPVTADLASRGGSYDGQSMKLRWHSDLEL